MNRAKLLDQLQSSPDDQTRLAVLSAWLTEAGETFDETAMDAAAELLVETDLTPVFHGRTEANARYLLASTTQTAAAWQSFFESYGAPTIWHRLSYARTLPADEAIGQLRRALTAPVPYRFFPRAQKLVAKLKAKVSAVRPPCPIALLGSSTTQLLAPVVEALCLRDGLSAPLYQGLYGAATQEILDPASGLHSFRPRIVFLLVNYRDLQLPMFGDAPLSLAETQRSLWERLVADFGCHVVQMTYDVPRVDAAGYLSPQQGRARAIEALNSEMRRIALPGVSFLDSPALQREAGAAWESPAEWYMFKQHPATEALPLLAEEMMAQVRAVLGLTRKVLALDLDNTLWQGIIGEDGLEGIKLGPGTPAGEAHRDLQRYALELKQRGIVLAVCSKNNPEEAKRPFLEHPHTVLKLDDFAVFEASWEDKAQALRNIAAKLSLGLDSFVFLDDSAIEREWVRSQLSQVAVVEPGASAFDYLPALQRGHYFDTLTLSAEDLQRAEQYRTAAQRENLRQSAGSLDDFLAGLQLRPAMEPLSPANLVRATQLINKTNQYNLTARRYTQAEVEQATWGAVFSLADRLGDYGQIGVILCTSPEASVWQIDTWLISCRALGRRVERFMQEQLVAAAAAHGIHTLRGVYRPNPRNGLVAAHYEDLGYRVSATSPEEIRYELTVARGASSNSA